MRTCFKLILVGPPFASEFSKAVCEVPCPFDCKLSPWSEWSDCSQVEGVGQRTRKREILESDPSNDPIGRPCPAHDGEKMVSKIL